MNTNTNNNIFNIITDSDHLVHMQSIPSVCPGAPEKKQNKIFTHTGTTSKTVKKLF